MILLRVPENLLVLARDGLKPLPEAVRRSPALDSPLKMFRI